MWNHFFLITVIFTAMCSIMVVDLYGFEHQEDKNHNSCIFFDVTENIISVNCKIASIDDVYNNISNDKVLKKEADKTWLLNANLKIEKNSIFNINQTDTNWLKMGSNSSHIYGLYSYGTLNINSTKITSWNETSKDYAETDGKIPRSFIVGGPGSTGPIHIVNSEICCLGYHMGGQTGLVYMQGTEHSKITGNEFYDMWYGFYSHGVGWVLIDDNYYHDNNKYSIDPHTGSHDITIRDNVIINTKGIGATCSEDCYNIIIENNEVFDSERINIQLSRNNSNSVIFNNTVSGSRVGIWLTESHNNTVSHNNITGSRTGIIIESNEGLIEDIGKNYTADNNVISNNMISGSEDSVVVKKGASYNLIKNNIISQSSNAIKIDDSDSIDNTFQDNIIKNATVGIKITNNTSSKLINNELYSVLSSYLIDTNSFVNIDDNKTNSDIVETDTSEISSLTKNKEFKFYGKGYADSTDPNYENKFLRTIIKGNYGTIINVVPEQRIEIIRIEFEPDKDCSSQNLTICFKGKISELKNLEQPPLGTKVFLKLNLQYSVEEIQFYNDEPNEINLFIPLETMLYN